MRFLKNEILFWEVLLVFFICLILNTILMFLASEIVILLSILMFLAASGLTLHLVLYKEYIVLNEEGIYYQRGKTTYWRYQWIEIAELNIVRMYRNFSVEIVLEKEYSCTNEEGGRCFQLGFSAKKALNNAVKQGLIYERTRGRFCVNPFEK